MVKRVMVLAGACFATMSTADMIVTTPLQVGGFFDGGGLDNKIEHQNYFVGYGTVGGERTSERRSFFWYHIPEIPGTILSATIKLKLLVTTSIVWGMGPGGPGDPDESETFQLGAVPVPGLTMVKPDLTPTEADAIFETMDDHPIADPVSFAHTGTLDFPMVVEIPLDAAGIGLLSTHAGADVVLTGSMPSWSYDDRIDPLTGKWLEGDELIFGFSDIPSLVPPPDLTISYAPVPEPGTVAVLGLGVSALLRRRRKR